MATATEFEREEKECVAVVTGLLGRGAVFYLVRWRSRRDDPKRTYRSLVIGGRWWHREKKDRETERKK
jgi:hypothetical protein